MSQAVTDGWSGIICSRGHGCRTVRVPRHLSAADKKAITEAQAAIAEWEAQRHANEARYWAEHLEEMVKRVSGLRRNRGDERAGRLARDVIEGVKAAHGQDAAVIARDSLAAAWRGQKPGWRV